MTLKAAFDKEKSKSIKDTMPDELLVYKAALIIHKSDPLQKAALPKYFSPILHTEYKGGIQSFLCDLTPFSVPVEDKPEKHCLYYPGFHSFVNKKGAEKLLLRLFPVSKDKAVILTCGVLKKWIIALGFEGDRELVVVSNKILIPSYPHRDIRDDKSCEWFFDASTEKIGRHAYLKMGLPLSSCSTKLSYPADFPKHRVF